MIYFLESAKKQDRNTNMYQYIYQKEENVSCMIEKFLEAHVRKLCVILLVVIFRSRDLRGVQFS